jgi:signal transduction histidine kinase
MLAWLAFTLVCVKTGLIADDSTWINVPVRFLGNQAFVTIFPPVSLCQIVLFMLGFEWAAIPAFLAMFVVCLTHDMSAGGSAITSLGAPVGLGICALIYRAAPLRVDLKTWGSVVSYVGITSAACIAGATGAFIWSAATGLSSVETFSVWKGWVLGAICSVVLVAGPALRIIMPRWLPVRARWFPPEPRRDSPFLLVTTCILVAGLVMAAFLTEASQLSTVRLMEALRNRVPPPVASAIREAVANWQVSAWTAIAMVVAMTVVGLGHAYWWAARWRKQHDDLVAATRRAEAASNVKSEFLAMISHELRTPLNGLLGMTQLLSATGLSEEQREYLAMADESGHQLLGLVNNLLDFAKIEAGRLEVAALPFSVRGVVEHATRLLGPKAASSGLAIAFEVGEGVPEIVVGDEDRLRQILMNLIGNAVKFTSDGSVTIRVALGEAGPPPVLRFAVQDTGIGMPPEVLDRLFQPFSQGDSSTTRRYGGTGLGLSICQRLANAMGGSVTAQSAVGQGSLFVVALPFGVSEPVLLTSSVPAETSVTPDWQPIIAP